MGIYRIPVNARAWEAATGEEIDQACQYLPRNLTRAEWQKYIGDPLPYQAVCENLPLEPEAAPTAIP